MPHPIWSLLRRLSPPYDPSSDAAVLRRFDQTRDETAFELLVWRHGGLVMGVCRRMLRDEHLAEDAFQATFLILARKAGAVRGSLAGWLHQVARRICLRARKTNPVPVEPGSDRVAVADPDPLLSSELRSILDDEIARLPEKQRLAVVLCYLQGRSTDDAAKLLGIPRGTVLSRLSTARDHLQRALTRRGISVPVMLFTGTNLTPDLTAEVCRRVTTSAVAFLHTPVIPTISTQLAHEVLGMTARKAILAGAVALVLTAGLGTGVGLVMAQGGKTLTTSAKSMTSEKADRTKAEQDRDEDNKRQAIQRSKRLEELAKSQDRVSQQIEELDHRRLKLVAEAGSDVDPKALLAKLDEIDRFMLREEERLEAIPVGRKEIEQEITAKKAGQFVTKQFSKSDYEAQILRRTNETPEAKAAGALLDKRRGELELLRGRRDTESKMLVEAEKLALEANEEVKKARTQVRASVEKATKEDLIQRAEDRLKDTHIVEESTKAELDRLRNKRREWVLRIQQSKAKQNAQQLIDDEIQVLREIRKQVLRDRLMLEMGLDDKAK